MKTKKELKEAKRMKNYWRRRLYVSKTKKEYNSDIEEIPSIRESEVGVDWKHFREMIAVIGISILILMAILYAIFGR